jgi:prepilin-type N-terminal cleavage/methylation domain-containing protein
MKSRNAFTMIELIFVIIIIGLLAAIAVPKLAATRDDAIHAELVSNTRICINDLISGYKGGGATLDIGDVASCSEAILKGASITYTEDAVRVQGVDDRIDGDYIFKGSRISI